MWKSQNSSYKSWLPKCEAKSSSSARNGQIPPSARHRACVLLKVTTEILCKNVPSRNPQIRIDIHEGRNGHFSLAVPERQFRTLITFSITVTRLLRSVSHSTTIPFQSQLHLKSALLHGTSFRTNSRHHHDNHLAKQLLCHYSKLVFAHYNWTQQTIIY